MNEKNLYKKQLSEAVKQFQDLFKTFKEQQDEIKYLKKKLQEFKDMKDMREIKITLTQQVQELQDELIRVELNNGTLMQENDHYKRLYEDKVKTCEKLQWNFDVKLNERNGKIDELNNYRRLTDNQDLSQVLDEDNLSEPVTEELPT